MSLNPPSSSTESVNILLHNVTITSIAVNWVDNYIYFTDSLSSSIKKCNMLCSDASDVATALENPRHLVFSSNVRYGYSNIIVLTNAFAL